MLALTNFIYLGRIIKASPIRIVYLLILSGRASRQVRRLIKRLYDGESYFYIHVDSRHDYMFREVKELEAKFPKRIYVAERRWASIWGGVTFLSMILDSFKTLLQKNWHWDFVLNLSESDYPLKRSKDLVKFLSNNRDKNFVRINGNIDAKQITGQGNLTEVGIFIFMILSSCFSIPITHSRISI